MVHDELLDRMFGALADPTRRAVLTRLGAGPLTVGELTEPTGMTITGMRKHLRILEDAGLVITEKVGRTRQCRLGTERLDEALAWIGVYQRLWDRRLDGLDAYFTLRRGAPATDGAQSKPQTTDRVHSKPQTTDRTQSGPQTTDRTQSGPQATDSTQSKHRTDDPDQESS